MMIEPGALCTCRQTGAILYVVKAPAPGGDWYLAAKRVDEEGRSDFTARLAGAGDIVVIREAPAYSPGEMIIFDGRYHEVASDNGDSVTLIAPAISRPLHGGGTVRLATAETITVPKADLILETFR